MIRVWVVAVFFLGSSLIMAGGGGHHHGENVDEGDKLFPIAKSNYVGVFGVGEIDDSPSRGFPC